MNKILPPFDSDERSAQACNVIQAFVQLDGDLVNTDAFKGFLRLVIAREHEAGFMEGVEAAMRATITQSEERIAALSDLCERLSNRTNELHGEIRAMTGRVTSL